MRNTDSDERTFFRTGERIFCMNGEWFFSTRAGQEGPYPNKAIAERELERYVRECSEVTELEVVPLKRPNKRDPKLPPSSEWTLS